MQFMSTRKSSVELGSCPSESVGLYRIAHASNLQHGSCFPLSTRHHSSAFFWDAKAIELDIFFAINRKGE
jgi:hypothetical protein